VDLSRTSLGERIAAAGGVVLFISMFLPWYAVEATVRVPGGPSFGGEAERLNAWQAFGFLDFLLFVIAAIAVAVPLLRVARELPRNLPASPPATLLAAGGFAVLFILFRLIDTPGPDIDVSVGEVHMARRIGIFIGLLAAAAITYGGYSATAERTPARR
jgi:hypothetical protein